MNKRESAIISAYTKIGFGAELFGEFHKYLEEKFQRSVWTHEMANKEFWRELKELSKNDFLQLAKNIID